MKRFFSQSVQTTVLFLIIGGILALAFGGSLGFVSDSLNISLVDAQSWTFNRFLAIQDFFTLPRDVVLLRQQNTDLENKVAKLEADIVKLKNANANLDALAALVNFSRSNPENSYISATVIGRDPSPFLRYIIIDQGSNVGLRRGMPVVTEQGLVGRVDAVINAASRVQLITDIGSAVNVRLEKAKKEAVLSGTVSGDLRLDLLSQEVTIETGDIVVTSGLSGGFPADLIVGQVINSRKTDSDLFQQAVVQPVVDFSKLKLILVITNFRPVDITPLIPSP